MHRRRVTGHCSLESRKGKGLDLFREHAVRDGRVPAFGEGNMRGGLHRQSSRGIKYGFRLEKETYRFMTPLSVRCIGVESAIQEWSGGAVKVSAGEGSGIEVTPVGEVFANDVENVCRDEVGARESHASPQGRGRG
jgi:hypothetical protein